MLASRYSSFTRRKTRSEGSWRPKPWTTRMPASVSCSVASTSATRSRVRR